MSGYSADEAAHRAGVARTYFNELIRLGLLAPADGAQFSVGDIRRAACIQALNHAGVPLEALAAGLAAGSIQLGFLDEPVYERFAATTNETYAQVSARTGIAFELLAVIRESLGSPPPDPSDYVRETELAMVPYVEVAGWAGYSSNAVSSLLRVTGDSLRRVAETEGALFYREILAPRLGAGEHYLDPDLSNRLAAETDNYIRAIYHGQQAHAWLRNVVNVIGGQLDEAGLHARSERMPAICFLDITGYTRLTQERGDDAAAELAEKLARIVQAPSIGHGGKPIKWLGDGVMFFFEDPAQAVEAALEMVGSIRDANLPPAHVGVACGEVLFRDGDYFGQTVNLAARIADFARPGEVLVSQAVVDAGGHSNVTFGDIGPVELKGVSEAVRIQVARATA